MHDAKGTTLSRREVLAAAALSSAPSLAVAAGGDADRSHAELEKIKVRLSKPEPINWLITGDSITHGALHTHGWRSYPEHFAERIRWELRRVRDVVINTGISGDTAPGVLSDLEHRVLRFKPTVVSIMMGMNDATRGPEGRDRFVKAYHTIIDRLRAESNALLMLQTPNPITPAVTGRQDLPAYAERVRAIATERGTALVDQDVAWRRRKTPLNYLLNDGTIHPNHSGHVLFALTMFEALGILDPASPTCRLYVP